MRAMTVIGPLPTITEEPQDTTVRITSMASFTVSAEGEGLSYQWQISTDGGETWTELEGETAATLRVPGTEENNGSQYRCIVTNRHGVSASSGAATLTVNGGKCGESAYWVLEDGVLLIFGEGAMEDYSAGGAPWYALREQITAVVIEEEISRIGNQAFYNCVNVTGAEIPRSVTAIGTAAFSTCTALEQLAIPERVTTIGNSAFLSCRSLRSIVIPDSVTNLGMKAFQGCSALEHVGIGSGVTAIGSGAFGNCSSLTAITIPETVRSIGTLAFSGCSALSEITFAGNAPTSIGSSSFNGVTATAYYPVNNETWTEDKFQNYGGTITWRPYGPVTLNLDACGGTVTPDTLTVSVGEAVGELPTPMREGWIFLGWFEAEAESASAAGQGEKITAESVLSANTTIYAHWRLPGDLNVDGAADTLDVSLLLRCVKYGEEASEGVNLDLNGDGQVDNRDVTRLIRYLRYHDVEIYG